MDGRQLLADFIARGTRQAALARAAECSEGHLSLYLRGKRGVSVPLAKRLSAATGGAVPVQALVADKIAEAEATLSEAAE